MIISKTPLRASLFGGGSDFREYYINSKIGYGSVLSVALNQHVYIVVNKKFDDMIRIVYNGNELVDSLDKVKHNIIREALRLVGINRGIEVIYTADIPLSGAGIGLASSSALAVGVLNALHAYKGEFISPQQLAREACYIEIECLGQKIGIQDQYAVAYGGFNQYKFMRSGAVSVVPVLLTSDVRDNLFKNLMLFYTGRTRDSREILKEQSSTIYKKMDMLDDLVTTVDDIHIALSKGNIDIVGTQLNRTWKIKKQFAKGVSNEEIDSMYTKAIDAGAVGGKILGAGGGGFLLLYVPFEKQADVRMSLINYKEVPFSVDYQGSRIVFVD